MFRLYRLAFAAVVAAAAFLAVPAHAQSYSDLESAFETNTVRAVAPGAGGGGGQPVLLTYSYQDIDGFGELAFKQLSANTFAVRLLQNGFRFYGSGTRSAPNLFGDYQVSFYILSPSGTVTNYNGFFGFDGGSGQAQDFRGVYRWFARPQF